MANRGVIVFRTMFVEREAILNRDGVIDPRSARQNVATDDQNGKTVEFEQTFNRLPRRSARSSHQQRREWHAS